MKVLAVTAAITLCLVLDSYSLNSQYSKSGRCNSKSNQTALLTEVNSILNILVKKSKEKLIDPMMKGKNQSSVKTKPSCNIRNEIKLGRSAITRRQIYMKFYYGIQIFLVTAKNFSALTSKNISQEVLKNETDTYKEIQELLNLVGIELQDCFFNSKPRNKFKIYQMAKNTKRKASRFYKKCFEYHDITSQKNYNNIIYYRQLRKFLKIGQQKLIKLDQNWRKKQHKDNQTGKSRKTQEDIRTK